AGVEIDEPVDVSLRVEVPVHDRHADRGAERRLRALPSRLDLARGRAPVAVDGVAVVALLAGAREDDAVAAGRRADAAGGLAVGLQRAEGAAPVPGVVDPAGPLAGIARLRALLDAVAARRLVADVHARRPDARPPALPATGRAAPVAVHGVAVIALLRPREDP